MVVLPNQAHAAALHTLASGTWRAELVSPGGNLPFLMEVAGDTGAVEGQDKLVATLVNGRERIPVGVTIWDGGSVVFDLHYDAQILARVDPQGRELSGEWIKRRGPERWSKMPFRAVHGE